MRGRISIKLKMTLWVAAFMILTAGLCLGLVLMISGRVARREAVSVLTITAREQVSGVSLADGQLILDEDFSFYKNDVYFLLYNKNQALLAGQTPPGFSVSTPFENGVTRLAEGEDGNFYVFDLWIPSGWEDGTWLRGVMRAADGGQTEHQILAIFSLIMPVVILTAALGGYLIARRALRPIEQITMAAESISGGKDLSRRIGLRRGKDEVGRLAAAFDQMFERLEQSFEAEKQFASDASHELRTPTAVIVAQCSYLEKYAQQPEDYKEGVAVIHRQADKMTQLINQLLDMTRLDFGTRKLNLEEIDFSAFLTAVCEEEDTGERGISISMDIPGGIRANVDESLFSRVIHNLMENARKYGKEGGWIRVSLSCGEKTVILKVEDNGIGIDEAHLNKIWQRFYQVSTSRESGAGLGLGLSMVRQIVHLHGGEVSAESRPGEGSMFTVILPKPGA
ncbi:MAG TPA: HAMP domain-containing histidine kinase [Candidatus Copromonas faecavium]|uniref:histidine kinase n=1 Tax=Candidatus Copromonas faecavium (nom. illeg.) TaxID=2840740 RepID=A0A9D1A3I3_9FIRM|nr:HAMP domain-containing histidine kinase [Candidatus Copromonas faecavium]